MRARVFAQSRTSAGMLSPLMKHQLQAKLTPLRTLSVLSCTPTTSTTITTTKGGLGRKQDMMPLWSNVRGFAHHSHETVDDDDTDKNKENVSWKQMNNLEKTKYLVSKYGVCKCNF